MINTLAKPSDIESIIKKGNDTREGDLAKENIAKHYKKTVPVIRKRDRKIDMIITIIQKFITDTIEIILKKLAKIPIKLLTFILLVLYNGLFGLYIDILQNITEKVERTIYMDNRSGKNKPICLRNPTLQI